MKKVKSETFYSIVALTNNYMFFIKYRKIFYAFSGILVGLAIVAIFMWGLRLSIDFTGGSITEFNFVQANQIEKSTVDSQIKDSGVDLGNYALREAGQNGFILKTKNISEQEKDQIIKKIQDGTGQNLNVTRFSNIGPSLGDELKNKAIIAIIVAIIGIVLYIAFVFRKVSKPVSSWYYGLITIIACLHDVLIPIGLYAVLGHFAGFEIDVLFIVAILVVLGYSINDTIVVFDRVRENLSNADEKLRISRFDSIVGNSLIQTIARSINTSLTTLVALFCILFLGGEAMRTFALVMIVGVTAGAYSSIFLAAPLLVSKGAEKAKN